MFNATSEKRLIGVHPDLVRVVRRAKAKMLEQAGPLSFVIAEGVRTKERQRELVAVGASRTMESRHITGHAIDLGAIVDGTYRPDWPLYYALANVMLWAAIQESVTIVWGGAWDRVMTIDFTADAETESSQYIVRKHAEGVRRPFVDGPHFELWKGRYPA